MKALARRRNTATRRGPCESTQSQSIPRPPPRRLDVPCTNLADREDPGPTRLEEMGARASGQCASARSSGADLHLVTFVDALAALRRLDLEWVQASLVGAPYSMTKSGRPRKPSVCSRTNMPGAAPVSEPMTLTDVAVEVSEKPVLCSARRTSTSPTWWRKREKKLPALVSRCYLTSERDGPRRGRRRTCPVRRVPGAPDSRRDPEVRRRAIASACGLPGARQQLVQLGA